jgi:peptidyl-prolyl cis-trans isomerase D
MIQIFRQLINSLIGRLLFGVLVLTFALLGVGFGFRDLVIRGLQSNDAATVGGTTISLQQLERDYRRDMSVLQRRVGLGFAPTVAQKQEIARQALDRLVSETLYADAAKDHGIRIGDDLLRRAIEEEPAFAGEDKRFDRGRFAMQLSNMGMGEAEFTSQLRRDLAGQTLIAPVVRTAVAPKALVEDVYRYRNEQRAAQTVFLPDSAVTGIPAPTDADLQAYYQKHLIDFTLPEYRTFTVLALSPDLFAGEITPTEDELQAAYESRKADFVVPEQRKIDQVVVSDKATADAIVKATADGKTSLSDAAKSATGGKVQPVTLDFAPKDQFPQALRDPVFATAKGGITGPVESPLGWHIVQVVDVKPGHSVSFDEAKPKLIAQLKHDGAIDRLSAQIDKLGDKLQGGTPMDQVAASVNATPVKVGPVDAKGNPPPGQAADLKRPQPDPAWLKTAFQLGSGETSSFEDAKDGGYFAVRLDSITPPAARPLAEVRADVVAGWTGEQQAKANAKHAEELAAKARSGTPMTEIAADAKTKMETTPAVTRESASLEQGDKALPPALIDALFTLGKIDDVTTVAVPGGQMVARLIEVHAADPHAPGVDMAPIARELDRGLENDQLDEFRKALGIEYRVKTNDRAVEMVAGQ